MTTEKKRNDQLESEAVKLDMIYKWLKPPGFGDFTLPLKLSTDKITETERSVDTNFKKKHKSFISDAFSKPGNDNLPKVCQEVANNVKKFVHTREKPNRVFYAAIILKTSYQFDKI